MNKNIKLHRISSIAPERGLSYSYSIDIVCLKNGLEERTIFTELSEEDLLALQQLIKEELSL